MTDFTDAATACIYLTNFLQGFSASSYEYQPDSIFRTFYIGDPIFLSWSSNTRKAMLFTDERIQSQFENSEQILIDSCTDNDYSVGLFLSEDAYSSLDIWNNIAVQCGGFVDNIDYNQQSMVQKLNYWFGESC